MQKLPSVHFERSTHEIFVWIAVVQAKGKEAFSYLMSNGVTLSYCVDENG